MYSGEHIFFFPSFFLWWPPLLGGGWVGWARALRPRPHPLALRAGLLVVGAFGSLVVISRPLPPVRARSVAHRLLTPIAFFCGGGLRLGVGRCRTRSLLSRVRHSPSAKPARGATRSQVRSLSRGSLRSPLALLLFPFPERLATTNPDHHPYAPPHWALSGLGHVVAILRGILDDP